MKSEQNKSLPRGKKKIDEINPTPCTLQTSVGETFRLNFETRLRQYRLSRVSASFDVNIVQSVTLAGVQRHTTITHLFYPYSALRAIHLNYFSSLSLARPQCLSYW